ncbi:Aste57867_4702 [Aphanomyces stellatus]|uniref:Aste57867_4702 protein n=1 Tax=Aphanomyces stellatus TaxID=120398 RepID=A0A485KD43_9STRA|nr:hypothetical protein As57867_004689 [Aphanomyces stellatus]VFT81802.1 Aste57867_4702 [Aphanomyces stellatus]
MAQHERDRDAEFDRLWRETLMQVMTCQAEKNKVRRRCLDELQALERLHTRDLRAHVPLGDTTMATTNDSAHMTLQTLRLRIAHQLSREQASLHNVCLASATETLEAICEAYLANAEMARQDDESRVWNRQVRMLRFLDHVANTNNVHPLPPVVVPSIKAATNESMLQPVHVDLTRFPNLAPRPRLLHAKDEAILKQLKQNADLVQRFEGERKQFKAKTDESSRAIAKLEASIKSMEEMMRVADDKAKDDASVIQLLQDKVKTCVVELPTKEIGPRMVVVEEAPDSPAKKTLLRGWK